MDHEKKSWASQIPNPIQNSCFLYFHRNLGRFIVGSVIQSLASTLDGSGFPKFGGKRSFPSSYPPNLSAIPAATKHHTLFIPVVQ